MSSDCDHDAILAAFRNPKTATRAVQAAYLDVHADLLLSQLLDESDDPVFLGVRLAAHLGDFRGKAGNAALRRAAVTTGPGTRDLRCASLLSLAKRDGVAAVPDLLQGLATPDAAIKGYAVIGLAGAGDDQAWEPVFQYLRAFIRRKGRRSVPSEVTMAMSYLTQHVADLNRRFELVTFVRERWSVIDEAEWFERFWPDAKPGGPDADAVPAPDRGPIRESVRASFFTVMGPPRA